MPVVYIDILFFTNLILDSILLVLTGRISGRNLSALRILCGGVLGGIYSISVFFAHMSFLSAGIVKLIVSALMIFAAYGFRSAKEFSRLLLGFYLSAFLLGGALAAIFYFSGRPGIMSNGVYYFPLSLFQLLITSLPLGIVLVFCLQKAKNRLLSYDKYCTVTIFSGEKKVVAEGIVDSGCSLTDPYLNLPAIIIDPEMAEKLLGKDYSQQLINRSKLRLIPYATIDSSGGCLAAFTPDKVIILSGNLQKTYTCTIAISSAFAGGKAIVNPNVFTHQI